MHNAGIMTANEIRAKEGLNFLEGADELLVQGAMVPRSMAGQHLASTKESSGSEA
jgi:hypothetical protein